MRYVQMPNEIFSDLKEEMDNGNHIAFAYTYYYYITYLYRYCEYIDGDGYPVTQERIKEELGYSPTNKKINYIIKKGGILDTKRYTETTTGIPMYYEFEHDIIEFITSKDIKNQLNGANFRNFKIKKPLKAFFRSNDAIRSNIHTGTFYAVENTHRIDHSILKYLPIINCAGFYIYGYLKHKNDIYGTGYQRSAEKIAQELNFSQRTVRKYLDLLEKCSLINIDRKPFDLNNNDEDSYEANIHTVKSVV